MRRSDSKFLNNCWLRNRKANLRMSTKIKDNRISGFGERYNIKNPKLSCLQSERKDYSAFYRMVNVHIG